MIIYNVTVNVDFDIAEVYARKMHKKLSEYKFNKKTYQKDLGKIYETVTKEKMEMQNKYDKETHHSIKKEEQAKAMMAVYKDAESTNAGYKKTPTPLCKIVLLLTAQLCLLLPTEDVVCAR